MKDLQNAKQMLAAGTYTCVLCKQNQLYTSAQRGVKPLLTWYEQGIDAQGFCAADKVIGKATAYLYVLLQVEKVYAGVISKPALEVLTNHNISVEYGTLVQNIINRAGNGVCSFEQAVLPCADAEQAYQAILQKMNELNRG